MTRIATLIVSLALSLATALSALAQTAPLPSLRAADQEKGPALKAQAAVAGEIVRIGDLVDHAGAVADVPIFRAPDLGQTGSVPAARVIDAVRPHQIIGLDTRGLTEVAVTRQSRAIVPADIEARVLRALASQYGAVEPQNLTVTFDNEVRTLHVEPTADAELRVLRLAFEPRNGRFDVTFEPPGSAATRRALRYTGTVSETFEAAVPARTLVQGEVLKAADVVLVRRPKGEFAANIITSSERAVGLAARHTLRAGQILRDTDVQRPMLVARNEPITITYEVPGILLTMRGQAQEAGALGDLISVLNVHSKKLIQATVRGPGHVTVAAPVAPRVIANAVPNNAR